MGRKRTKSRIRTLFRGGKVDEKDEKSSGIAAGDGKIDTAVNNLKLETAGQLQPGIYAESAFNSVAPVSVPSSETASSSPNDPWPANL
ncbi:hypothetical protein FQN52_006046 [Onygenales sp. PD_12]|nr:hypothetical protein FQN52_006046 [Onygenales sp. PD_12]KAK2797224.1 hypothetical protein FQN51_008747 [Onygenales sp. PD_10]